MCIGLPFWISKFFRLRKCKALVLILFYHTLVIGKNQSDSIDYILSISCGLIQTRKYNVSLLSSLLDDINIEKNVFLYLFESLLLFYNLVYSSTDCLVFCCFFVWFCWGFWGCMSLFFRCFFSFCPLLFVFERTVSYIYRQVIRSIF